MTNAIAICSALLGSLLAATGPLGAQSPNSNPASAPEPERKITRAWLSAGLGSGALYRAAGPAYRSSANLSVDRLVLTFRKAGGFEGFNGGPEVYDSSVLGGFRLGGRYLYMIPALGLGKARFKDDVCSYPVQCTPDVAAQYVEKGSVVAYDVGFYASRLVAGLSVNVVGTAGGPKRNFMGLVISLNFGWFGR